MGRSIARIEVRVTRMPPTDDNNNGDGVVREISRAHTHATPWPSCGIFDYRGVVEDAHAIEPQQMLEQIAKM